VVKAKESGFARPGAGPYFFEFWIRFLVSTFFGSEIFLGQAFFLDCPFWARTWSEMLRSVKKAAGTAGRIHFLSSAAIWADWSSAAGPGVKTLLKTLLALVRHRYQDESDAEADRTTDPITSDMAMLQQ
jgi:hypothetical protein